MAEILFRVNPNVSPKTHPKIATGLRSSKFGIPAEQAQTYQRAMDLEGVNPVGLHCYIGSQILDTAPSQRAAGKMMDIARAVVAKGGEIKRIDLGGDWASSTIQITPPPLQNSLMPSCP